MLSTILIIAAVVLMAVLVRAATKPSHFRVERATSIKAPAERIFPYINDLRRWNAWSPYEKKDPDMKRTFGATTAGPGAAYAWDGDKNVGKGRMEIIESTPSSRVAIKLDFEKPFEAHNIAEFTLQPNGASTKVVWVMDGPASYVTKLMSVFLDMDKMIGTDFEAGLASLKAVTEA
jgi:uncharacterized protein YndB with AHSA1/START domain